MAIRRFEIDYKALLRMSKTAIKLLVATSIFAISSACHSVLMKKDVADVQIRLVDPTNKTAPSLVSTFAKDEQRTKQLTEALSTCKSSDPLKFKPRYQVTVRYTDNSQQVFMVLGNHAKIEGLTQRCGEDIEKLIDQLRS